MSELVCSEPMPSSVANVEDNSMALAVHWWQMTPTQGRDDVAQGDQRFVDVAPLL